MSDIGDVKRREKEEEEGRDSRCWFVYFLLLTVFALAGIPAIIAIPLAILLVFAQSRDRKEEQEKAQ